jgi:hypothetical protein
VDKRKAIAFVLWQKKKKVRYFKLTKQMSKPTTKKAPRTDWKKKYEAMEADFEIREMALSLNNEQIKKLKSELDEKIEKNRMAGETISNQGRKISILKFSLSEAETHIKNLVNAADFYKEKVCFLSDLLSQTINSANSLNVERAASFVDKDKDSFVFSFGRKIKEQKSELEKFLELNKK